ncbi:MAG TPA: TonB-dependent receptor [Burkholderiales bacterium]|nr:TonB-dependent receptor [Burkholderiales bacterium]
MRTVAFGLAAGLACSFAFAQDDSIVITATRFADSKRDLPVGVTVITADDIQRSASSNLGDILAQYGLLQIRDLAGTQNPQVDLRGFGITGDQNTLVMIDGLRISENEVVSAQLSAVPLDSIERIEIVRGSGAVLYGANATAGTVNIITRRPKAGETRGRALGRYGSFRTKEARVSGDTAGESVGAGFAVSTEDTDGYRRNSTYRQTSFGGRLEAFGNSSRAYLKLGADQQSQRLPGSLTEQQIKDDPRQTRTPDDWSTRDGAHVILGGSHALAGHELAADLGYRRKSTQAFFALFGGFFTDTDAEVWNFSPRAKFALPAFGRKHELIVGAEFEGWEYETRSSSSPSTISSPFSRRVGTQDSSAGYAQASIWATDSTRIVLGGRLQLVDQNLEEKVFPLDKRGRNDTLRAWEAALRQGLGGGVSTYAKYGTSFRLANFDENACFFPPCNPNLLLPQTAKTVEAGLEVERSGVSGRASVYQTDLENEIYFSPLTFSNVNLQPTRRRGVELETRWRATQTLDLRAAAAWIDARFREGVYGGVDVSGNKVPLVPERIATAGLSWLFLARSRFNFNLRYVGRQRFDNDQTNTQPRQQPSYTVADLKLEQRLARWELAFEVRNLFNRKYFSYGTATGPDSFSALPASGIAAYATVGYRLD